MWFGQGPVGDLARSDFAAVWSEPRHARFRDDAASGVLTRACCATCPPLGDGSVDSAAAFGERTPWVDGGSRERRGTRRHPQSGVTAS